MPERDCTEKRVSLKTVGSVILAIVCIAGSAAAYYFTTESGQNHEISVVGGHAENLEKDLSTHIGHSTEAFKSLETAMVEQRKLTQHTRETLSAVNATQTAIKEENGRLAQSIRALATEVRRMNGHRGSP